MHQKSLWKVYYNSFKFGANLGFISGRVPLWRHLIWRKVLKFDKQCGLRKTCFFLGGGLLPRLLNESEYWNIFCISVRGRALPGYFRFMMRNVLIAWMNFLVLSGTARAAEGLLRKESPTSVPQGPFTSRDVDFVKRTCPYPRRPGQLATLIITRNRVKWTCITLLKSNLSCSN